MTGTNRTANAEKGNNMPPELQKQIDELAEQAVDDWVEQRHAHEIVPEQPNDALVDEGY